MMRNYATVYEYIGMSIYANSNNLDSKVYIYIYKLPLKQREIAEIILKSMWQINM